MNQSHAETLLNKSNIQDLPGVSYILNRLTSLFGNVLYIFEITNIYNIRLKMKLEIKGNLVYFYRTDTNALLCITGDDDAGNDAWEVNPEERASIIEFFGSPASEELVLSRLRDIMRSVFLVV